MCPKVGGNNADMYIAQNKIMKDLIFSGILILSFNLVSFGQLKGEKVETIEGWTSLSNEDYSIQYPEDWELNQSGLMGTVLILFSPIQSEEDQFRENVNFLKQDLTGYDLNLDDFVEISEGQLKTLVTEVELIESKRINGKDLNYHRMIYAGRQGIFDLKFEQYYWVINNTAYVLTLTCERSEFNNYKKTGEKILNSFSIQVE